MVFPSAEQENAQLRLQIAELQSCLTAAEALNAIAPGFFGLVNSSGEVMDLNEQALGVIEASREQIVGKRFWECPWWSSLPESARKVRAAVLEGALGSPAHFDIEYCAIIQGQAHTRWVALEIRPIQDRIGSVSRMAITGIDITDRKSAQFALKKSQEQLSLAIAVSKVGFFDLDVESQKLVFSEQLLKDWGVERVSTVEEALTSLHPDDQDRVRTLVAESIAERRPYFAEYRVIRPDGSQIWVEARGEMRTKADGTPVRLVGTAVNITERKSIEAKLALEKFKLEAIFRDSPAAMSLRRGKSNILEMVNPRYQAIFGQRQLIGRPVLEALPELRNQKFPEYLKQVFETGKPYVGHEELVQVTRQEGGPLEERYFDFSYVRINDPEGKPYGIYNHSVEVTEQVLARKRLEETKKQLEEGVRALELERELREKFVAALSHDLRTPLTAAVMSAHILARKLPDPVQLQRLTGRIINNLDRVDQMIRDLLDASRMKAGEAVHLGFALCDYNGLIQATIEDLKTLHGDRFQIVAPAQVLGTCDETAIRRVIENLVINAVKYGSATAPIQIRLRQDGEWAEIAVRNEGNPIPAEAQRDVFEPYRRADSAAQGAQKGWGIGLTLVRGFVEAHGGTVQLESDPAAGTTFIIRLPLESPTGSGG